MKNILGISLVFSLLLLVVACADESSDGTAPGTGSIAAQAVWPGDPEYVSNTPQGGETGMVAPPGVVTMRAIISGPGMSNVQQDFNAAAGSGLVNNVPSGLNRMLTLQGLDGGGGAIFQGTASSLTVTAGQTTVTPPVSMNPASGVPYVLVTPGATTINEIGGTGNLTVSLNSQPNGTVVINVSSPETDEALVSDLGNPTPTGTINLNFSTSTGVPGGWDQPQTVTVTGVRDFIQDGNQNFDILLSIGAGTTDTTGYNSHTPAQVLDVPVTIVDGDQPGVTVNPGTTTFSENGGVGNFTVVLNSIPDGNVVVDVTSPDPTKVVVTSGGTLTFVPGLWNVPQPVTLTGQDDSIADGPDQVTITVDVDTASTADLTGYKNLTPGDVDDVPVTLTDNDSIGVLVTPGTTTFSENSGTGGFSVVLNSEPTGNVVLTVTSTNPGEALVSSGGSPATFISLTFNNSNWFMVKNVTVTGQDDLIVDGQISVPITVNTNVAGTTDDTGYQGFNPNDVTVTVTDNEIPIVYVTTLGNDGNPGTKTSPFLTIQAAIDHLDSIVPAGGEVQVRSGTYNVTYPSTHVSMVEGISVTGGYTTNSFTVRTPGLSIIQDTSNSGGSENNATRAVEALSGITTATVFDGFTVSGGSGTYTSAIFITGSPTISKNELHGGSGSAHSNGILTVGGSPNIFNNTIHGGTSAFESHGIRVRASSPLIYNNTISGGNNSACRMGIHMDFQAAPAIDNNIIFAHNIATPTCAWGLYDRSVGPTGTGQPTSVRNNDFFDLDVLYRNLVSGSYSSDSTIAAMETNLDTEGVTNANNVNVDPVFQNQAGGNWRLRAITPNAVKFGGLTLSAFFTDDKDLNSRTASWSIGAYERN